MFDIGASELLLIVVLAIVVIGPKDLPMALRTAGRWIGKVRRVSGHFRTGIETMIREAELEEMEKKWREENQRILAQYPADAYYPEPEPAMRAGEPDAMPPVANADQPDLPLEAPAAPDDDPRPPSERELP